MVVVEGHLRDRCKAPVPADAVVRLRRMAWLGDVRHSADIRILLLCSGVPENQLQLRATDFVCNKHMSDYYKSYNGPKEKALGSSVHSVATAFEASYVGLFRRDYLVSIAGQFDIGEVDGSLVGHVEQLVGSKQ